MTAVPSLARAALRLSPRQIAHHLKRKLRNEFAHRFPEVYASFITRKSQSLPHLSLGSAPPTDVARDMAKLIEPFYREEYVAAIDDAAEGRFTFFGQSAVFAGPQAIDWHHTVTAESDFHLWRMKLGQMGFMCPMLISGNQRHQDAARNILVGYRAHAGFGTPGCFSSYWFPYSVSHRVLAILSGYVLAHQSLDGSLRREIESFLQWNAGFISANLEHELKNNHVERNLAALCFYYTCAESVPSRVASQLDREVRHVIEACVLGDGFIAERSAMYQGLTVMALDIFARAPFLSTETRSFARWTHTKALRAWVTMTHPDGEIALFNDSWLGEVPPASQIVGELDVEPVAALTAAGYVRLQSEGVFVLMDAGPIGPRWNPGHGHADFLAIEADISGQRFIVDPGTFQYSTGPRRTFERSASSHNGPHRRGLEPVEYAGCFRVGRLSEACLETPVSNDYATGRLPMPDGSEVARTVAVTAGIVRITDVWSIAAEDAGVRLTIAGAWKLTSREPASVEFQANGSIATIHVVEGALGAAEAGEWSRHYLASETATILTLTPDPGTRGDARLVWEIRKQESE